MKKVTIEDPHRLLLALNQVLGVLRDVGFGESHYGFFAGGDPRHFTPDAESTTPEEYERWQTDCQAFANGEKKPTPPSCSLNDLPLILPNKKGEPVEHAEGTVLLTRSFYGLGVNCNTDEADIVADLWDLKRLLEESARSDA